MIVISTHHTSLKVYGANTWVINASVGFDEATLQPLRTEDRVPELPLESNRAALG